MNEGIIKSEGFVFEFVRQEEAYFGEYFLKKSGLITIKKRGNDGKYPYRSKYLCPFFQGRDN